MMKSERFSPVRVTLLAAVLVTLPAFAQENPDGDLIGSEPVGPRKPAPRAADGHPDFNGFWKGDRKTKPVGNIGKDLPGFKLPLTPEGEAALKHILTATVDPEAVCIIGGMPRHNASGLPFMVMQTPKLVSFLYFYTYYRLIPVDGRFHHVCSECSVLTLTLYYKLCIVDRNS